MSEIFDYPRDFKGIWIPKEIWLDENLTAIDKIIFSEINSLDVEDSDGCYASNEYLASFCKCGVTKVSTSISKLTDLGYIKLVKTDGRKRWLKTCLSKNERQAFKNRKPDIQKQKQRNIPSNRDDKNSIKHASPDKSGEDNINIYASFPEEKEVCAKKQSRYIPDDYTEEQLVEHIRPTIENSINYICDEEDNKEKLSETLIEIIRIFYKKYYIAFGKRHKILSDMAYKNIAERFMFPPEIMCDEDTQYDIKSYADMMDVYFTTEYNKQKKYGKDIELSISHFMSENIRSNLYYRTRNLEE